MLPTCPTCSAAYAGNEAVCQRCGTPRVTPAYPPSSSPVSGPAASAYTPPAYPANPYPPNTYPANPYQASPNQGTAFAGQANAQGSLYQRLYGPGGALKTRTARRVRLTIGLSLLLLCILVCVFSVLVQGVGR